MLKTKFIAVIGATLALAFAAAPVAAQTPPTTAGTPDAEQTESEKASGTIRGESVLPGRVGGGRQAQERPQSREQRRDAARRGQNQGPTPEQNRAAAQAVAVSLGNSCQVTEASLLGARPEGGNIYEAACATGPGFIFEATTPPRSADCVDLAGAAAMLHERDPAANAGLQCTLPGNQNTLTVIAGYAQQAGVTCQVDAGMATAINRYEIGCANADGYWIERQEGSWAKIPCWDLKIEGQLCRFTTDAEANSAWTGVLAGTAASGCEVQQARKVGIDAQRLAVYEVKCASGDGWMARVDLAGVAKRVQACTDPAVAALAGGCQLTTAAPAAAPTE
ncbi:MAG TPA: hypothetical protein VGE54_05965 [Brevundimonas sp.]